MAKKDSELFDRLREAGLRKPVARALSEVRDDSGNKAQRRVRAAIGELRSLADELERRLPGHPAEAVSKAVAKVPMPRSSTAGTRSTAAKPAATRSTAAKPAASRATPAKPATTRRTTTRRAPAPKPPSDGSAGS